MLRVSAILGVLRLDGSEVDRESFERMLAAPGHYGPDGSGACDDIGVALGHQNLRVLDTIDEQRLIRRFGSSRVAIVGDIRLDKREELHRSLGLSTCSGTSDEAVVIEACLP